MNILRYSTYNQLIVSQVGKLLHDNHVYVMLHIVQMQSKVKGKRRTYFIHINFLFPTCNGSLIAFNILKVYGSTVNVVDVVISDDLLF